MIKTTSASEPTSSAAVALQERRSWIRFPCPPGMRGLVTFGPGHPTERAKILNMSGGSIGFLMNHPTTPGTLLTVELLRGNDLCPLQARVVRVMAHQGEWLYGCELVTQLTVEELVELLGEV